MVPWCIIPSRNLLLRGLSIAAVRVCVSILALWTRFKENPRTHVYQTSHTSLAWLKDKPYSFSVILLSIY